MDASILVVLFYLVGLQPWALVMLVAVGRWEMDRRRGRRIRGMPGRGKMKMCKLYYLRGGGQMAAGKEEEESKGERTFQEEQDIDMSGWIKI